MRWIGRGLTVAVALALLGLVGFNVWLRWSIRRHNLPEAEKAALAAGLVLSPEDLHRPTWPREQDAGPDWLAIAQRRDINLHSRAEDEAYKSLKSARLAPEQVAALRRAVAAQRPVMAAVRRAAAKPHARFDHAFSVRDTFPYLAPMRSAVKRMRMESALLSADGRPLEAVRTMAPALRVAQQAEDDPTILAVMVSSANERIADQHLADLLSSRQPDRATAAAVRTLLAGYQPRRNLRRAIQGETLMGLQAAQETGRKTGPGGRVLSRQLMDANAAVYLSWMTRYYRAAGLQGRARAEHTRALDAAFARSSERIVLRNPAYMLSTVMMPRVSKLVANEDWTNSVRATVLAGADVLEARARTGAWPERLPHAIADPFAPEKSLGYRREGKGFVVYSGGPTGRFTAAAGQPTRMEAYFRYPRAAEGASGGS